MDTDTVLVSRTELSELEIVKTFMRGVDVVSSIRKLESVEDYLELLELFYTDGERKSALLPELLERQDMDRYIIEVHGLKSAAANIGAEALSALAKEHEFAGKGGKAGWIGENVQALLGDYRALLDEIGRVLSLHGYGRFAAREDVELPPLGAEDRAARIGAALGFLEDFDSKEAAREVEELLGFALPEELRDGLEKVRSLLKVYEDDQAEELLRSLAEG